MTTSSSARISTTQDRRGRFTRRALLSAAGAGAVAAHMGGATDAAAIPRGSLEAPTTDGRWHTLVREKTLHHVTLMQSFAFDDVGARIYALQLSNTGNGDMCLNQLDEAGNLLGHMQLNGFGHGGSIGVERDGAATYLWTETDANPSSGYGRAITRFPYAAGTTLTYGESDMVVHRPVPGSTSNQPYIDQESRRLIVRHRVSGTPRYAIFDLDAAIAGDFDPLHSIDQYVGEEGEVFQGFCLHRDRVHQSTGSHYTDEDGNNPPSGGGDAYVATIDAATGDLVTRTKNLVAPELYYREPEGMAIQHGRSPRMVIGLASGPEGARKFSLFHRNFAAV